MAFFRKKPVEAAPPKKPRPQETERTLSEIVHERVLTAEGWRRKTLPKSAAAPKKPALK